MKHATKTSKRFSVFVASILAFVLFFAFGAAFIKTSARADEADYTGWHEAVSGLSNGQFESTGSGDIPSPSDWTGAALNGNDSAAKHGVLVLSDYASKKDDYKLEQYDEYKGGVKPVSPFAKKARPGENSYNDHVLLINANGTPTAYGYTSGSFDLAPNSYYRFSAWVKTGGLDANSGAAILLNGVGDDAIGFTGIDTERFTADEDNLGWAEYTIYVETAPFGTSTATLGLQLGHSGVGGLNNLGYAMFDNVTATQLSSKSFFEETAHINNDDVNSRKIVRSFAKGEYLRGGDFSADYTRFGKRVGKGLVSVKTVNAVNAGETSLGLSKALYAPIERTGNENYVLAISTYNVATGKFELGYGGVESDEFMLERYSYYRISAWYNSDKLEEGNQVSAKLSYKGVLNDSADDKDWTSDLTSNLALTNENYNHNGWNELSLYVKGSDIQDSRAKLTLSLGSYDASSDAYSESKGVALFDEVKIQKITPQEYTDNSSNGNKSVSLDSLTDSTGINNGWFNTVSSYDELEYVGSGDGRVLKNPLVPSGWTKTTSSDGYTTDSVSTDEVVSGLVPVEEVDALKSNTVKTFGNVLKISSDKATKLGYTSESFTVAANSYNALTVSLTAENLGGYGANLILRKGSSVVSTIEKITESGSYTFYIKGGAAESSMSLELWLGCPERNGNIKKRANGTVYFTEVKLATDSTEEIYNAQAESYSRLRMSDNKYGISFATVNLGVEDLSLFDSYDDNALKAPYNWSVSTESADKKVNYGVTVENGKNIIKLQNTTETYSTLTLNNTFALEADKYYKLTVSLKAHILTENAEVGAYLAIVGKDELRFDFKNTAVTSPDYGTAENPDIQTPIDDYVTYTFYIKSASEAGTVSVVIGLGSSDSSKPNQKVAGDVMISEIAIEDFSNLEYDEKVKDLKEDVNLISKNEMRVDFTPAATEETPDDNTANDGNTEDGTDAEQPTTNGGLEWWLVPSILLAIAVIVAIVGSFIRKRIESRPKKTETAKKNSYDRAHVEKNAAMGSEGTAAADTDDVFESFDDTKNVELKNVTAVEAQEVPSTEETKETSEATENAETTEEQPTTETEETAEAQPEVTETQEATEQEPEKAEEAVKSETETETKPDKTNDEYVDDFED